MTTYKNTNFTKRNYDCTNVVYCQAKNESDILRPGKWVACDSDDNNLDQLFTENGVRYFGYM